MNEVIKTLLETYKAEKKVPLSVILEETELEDGLFDEVKKAWMIINMKSSMRTNCQPSLRYQKINQWIVITGI